MSSTAPISRSVYLSRLRRAFLLRVHPDRFRTRDASIRMAQASLVKALGDRLSRPDFIQWQSHERDVARRMHLPYENATQRDDHTYPYVVERRDGSLLREAFCMNGTVEDILTSMSDALQRSGASVPQLPSSSDNDSNTLVMDLLDRSALMEGGRRTGGVDHSLNIVSRQGRDLCYFLSSVSHDDIRTRQSSRTDAQAMALEVRKLYQFLAVDATSLGWSSASVSVLLSRLLELYEEHSSAFHVDSFYPVRLVFTADEFMSPLDLYGGVLRLNPGLTPLQWLETFQLVTNDTLAAIRENQALLLEISKLVQGTFGVKIRKGYSCSSEEHFEFVTRLQSVTTESPCLSADERADLNSLILEPVTITVESSQVCRRPKVTKEGAIRLGAGMTAADVQAAVARFGGQARERRDEYVKEQARCKQAIHQMQWEFGLQRVYKQKTVDLSQFLECLSRILLVSENDQRQQLQVELAGNSLGIASSGHFCHLSDDGSLVIPYDWR